MNEVPIGVVGAGVLGSHHLRKCLINPQVRLSGFYDADPARREAAARQLGVKAYPDMDALLAETAALIIATPCSTHHGIARQCLDLGKHLLIEKPLAASYGEGEDLVMRAHKNGTVLHVGHSEAFNAAFIKLASLHPVPRFIEVHRLAQFSPRGTDVPVVLDLMVHDLQLIMRLCGEEPLYDRIAATGVPVVSADIDIANVRLTFPSGCVANLTASRISIKRMRKIRIFAPGEYFSVDLDKSTIDRGSLLKEIDPATGLPISFARDTITPADALEAELQAFIDAIEGRSRNRGVDGREALVVLRAADVILAKLASGTV